MSLENVETAAPVESAPAPVSNEPISSDDLAGLFKAELDAESAPAPKPQPEAPTEAAPEIESAAPAEPQSEDQLETSVEDPSQAAPPTIRGMSADERAVFEQLPPEAKAWIAKREKDQQADYTRKTQEVAEHRKTYEANNTKVLAQLQQYDQILSQFTARPLTPPDPALRQTDPLGYDEQMANYVHQKHHQEAAIAEQQRVRQEYDARAEEQKAKHWNEQRARLTELAPELITAPKAKENREAVFKYALEQGYSKEQLNLASAADMVTLWKAQRYDAAVAQKASVKPVAPIAPKVMQPGPAKAAGRSNGFAQSVKALSENPSRAALAEAFRAELNAER